MVFQLPDFLEFASLGHSTVCLKSQLFRHFAVYQVAQAILAVAKEERSRMYSTTVSSKPSALASVGKHLDASVVKENLDTFCELMKCV